MFTVQNFVYLLILVINVFLGLKILFKKNKTENNLTGIKIFSFLQFLLAYWSLMLILITVFDYNIWVSRFVYLGPILIPLFLLLFVWHYPVKQPMGNVLRVFFNYILPFPTIFFTCLLFTDLFFLNIDWTTSPPSPVFNDALYLLYMVYSYGYIFVATVLFFIRFKNSKGFERLQLKYLIIGIVITAILVLLINVVLPAFGIHEFRQMSPFAFFFFDITTFVALSNERLFSIRTILSKALKVILLGIILFIIVYLVRTIQDRLFHYSFFQLESLIIDFCFSILAAVFILFYIDKFRLSIGIIAKERGIELSDLLHQLDIELNGVYEDREVKIKSIEILNKKFPKVKIDFRQLKSFKIDLKKHFNKKNTIITQELDDLELQNYLDSEKVAIVSLVDEDLILVFYQKKSFDAFTKEELDVIDRIAYKLSVIFERNRLYKDVKGFSNVLQKKVDEQTQELKIKYVELEKANQKEKDMLDILGHELRTPITIARNAISLMISNRGAEKVDEEKFSKYLDMADENIKREIVLLETMLSATKIDNAKLELKLEKVDMLDVIHDTLLAEESKAKEKGLQIKTELPSECFIFVDRVRIQEVVDNLINNAVKYTNEGSVKIILEENHDFALLSIIDTGIGISAQDLKNLGKKFYRANNYLEKSEKADFHVVRPGGTGLGLYVTFELVTAMGGEIVVASSLGKGTRFTAYLPKYKTQEPQILKISEPEGPNKVLIEEFVSKD